MHPIFLMKSKPLKERNTIEGLRRHTGLRRRPVSAKSLCLVQGSRLVRERSAHVICNPPQRETQPSQPTQGGDPWLGVSLKG